MIYCINFTCNESMPAKYLTKDKNVTFTLVVKYGYLVFLSSIDGLLAKSTKTLFGLKLRLFYLQKTVGTRRDNQ